MLKSFKDLLRCRAHYAGWIFTEPKADRNEVLQNSIKVGCNTRLKGVGNLPRKTDLKLYFELGLNRLSVTT